MGSRETRRESLVDLEADSRGSCPCCVGEWKEGENDGGDSDTITHFTSSVEEASVERMNEKLRNFIALC